jgi:2,4-dienoyl-CoA reductase-like NADH-dependent reductase (Old Yellow Enzyme family)
MPSPTLSDPLKLPCGAVLPNRIAKAAMTEGLADADLHATQRHQTLYGRWSDGGAGLLLTGNVMIDRTVLERPGNVAIDPAEAEPAGMEQLRAWAREGTRNGNHLWMQISHAGRQSPRYVTRKPVGPSAVQLKLMGNHARPRALEESEILDYADAIRKVCQFPLMVTGGFRTRTMMEEALASGNTDMIGLGRPLCTDPDTPRGPLDGTLDKVVCHEDRLQIARRGWLSPWDDPMAFLDRMSREMKEGLYANHLTLNPNNWWRHARHIYHRR